MKPRHRSGVLSISETVAIAIVSASLVLSAVAPQLALGQGKEIGGYVWSQNQSFGPASESHIQVQPALTSDTRGNVWLVYLDADVRKIAPMAMGAVTIPGGWSASPRRVVLRVSEDQGRSFGPVRIVSQNGGDAEIAASGNGKVYLAFTDLEQHGPRTGNQRSALGASKIIVARIDPAGASEQRFTPLPWDAEKQHAEPSLAIDARGVRHVAGIDTGFLTGRSPRKITLLYGTSPESGVTPRELESVGHNPQIAIYAQQVFIAGPSGYVHSRDGGKTFSRFIAREFGQRLARTGFSPDGRTLYVVGDTPVGAPSYAARRGLKLHISVDRGETWEISRVDDADRASAWRFPAMHIERSGRVHIVWMDDRSGYGGVYHAYSDDGGRSFSPSVRISDAPFVFPAKAPLTAVAINEGTWIGAHMSITSVAGTLLVAWSDQRAGLRKSALYYVTGTARR